MKKLYIEANFVKFKKMKNSKKIVDKYRLV